MKRKATDSTQQRMDEADRTLYPTFRAAANSLSQLYTQSMVHQKLSFLSGERHSLEKLYEWILRQHEQGSRLVIPDILSHIRNEIDYGIEDVSTSPTLQLSNQQSLGVMQFPASVNQQQSFLLFGSGNTGLTSRGHPDQAKISNFCSAHIDPGREVECFTDIGRVLRSTDLNYSRQNRHSSSLSLSDASMDIPEGPSHGS